MDPAPSTHETIFLCPYVFSIMRNQTIPFTYFSVQETVEKRQAFQSRTYQIIYLKAFFGLEQARLQKGPQIFLQDFKNLRGNEYNRFSNRHTPKECNVRSKIR